jgi:hypothetical protein
MALITNSIWNTASHPLVHVPALQAIGIGSFILRMISNIEDLRSCFLGGFFKPALEISGGYSIYCRISL